jgi:hypothetical protein
MRVESLQMRVKPPCKVICFNHTQVCKIETHCVIPTVYTPSESTRKFLLCMESIWSPPRFLCGSIPEDTHECNYVTHECNERGYDPHKCDYDMYECDFYTYELDFNTLHVTLKLTN